MAAACVSNAPSQTGVCRVRFGGCRARVRDSRFGPGAYHTYILFNFDWAPPAIFCVLNCTSSCFSSVSCVFNSSLFLPQSWAALTLPDDYHTHVSISDARIQTYRGRPYHLDRLFVSIFEGWSSNRSRNEVQISPKSSGGDRQVADSSIPERRFLMRQQHS